MRWGQATVRALFWKGCGDPSLTTVFDDPGRAGLPHPANLQKGKLSISMPRYKDGGKVGQRSRNVMAMPDGPHAPVQRQRTNPHRPSQAFRPGTLRPEKRRIRRTQVD